MFKLRNGTLTQKIINIKFNLTSILDKCKERNIKNFQQFNKFFFSSIYDKNVYISNKNFAAKFRDTQEFHYLYNINLINLLNSMFVLRRNFDTIVFLGTNPEIFLEKIPQNITPKTFIYCDISEENLKISKLKIDTMRGKFQKLPKNMFPLLINPDKWPFKENSVNCIINNLLLHNVENLEEYLKQINNSLVPDGCFLSNFFSNETFDELKFVMNLAENEREGGVSQNVLNFLQISDMGNILHKLKYTLPSFNVNKYRYKFHDLTHLFEFLKIIGETNFLKNRRLFKRKDTYISAMAIYQSMFNHNRIVNESDEYIDHRVLELDFRRFDDESKIAINDYIYASVQIATFITWKFHPSQQKPKERGSAEFSLKDLATDILETDKENEIRFGKIELKESIGKEDEFEIVEMTEIIKDKIKKKLGEEVVNEKLENLKNNLNKEAQENSQVKSEQNGKPVG